MSACAGSAPAWYVEAPRLVRDSAYERFLVTTGTAVSRDRKQACSRAYDRAFEDLVAFLIKETEARSDVIAAAGGPARFERVIREFARQDVPRVNETERKFLDSDDRCYLELRWLMPRHLAEAVRRSVESTATEDDVAREMRLALGVEATAPGPIVRGSVGAAPTPAAAIGQAYPRWFLRLIPVPDCPTHVIAFVGAPGGTESRWLELRRTNDGWNVIADRPAPHEGWPDIPVIPGCD